MVCYIAMLNKTVQDDTRWINRVWKKKEEKKPSIVKTFIFTIELIHLFLFIR